MLQKYKLPLTLIATLKKKRPKGPVICCIRLSCLSFSVSANFTTKLDDAPYNKNYTWQWCRTAVGR
jgi:hypothetical protein